jgi:hypothetical protein
MVIIMKQRPVYQFLFEGYVRLYKRQDEDLCFSSLKVI